VTYLNWLQRNSNHDYCKKKPKVTGILRNYSSTRRLLALARRRLLLALARRRLPADYSSSMSKRLVPARRLLLALARRRPPAAKCFSTRLHELSSCGSAVTTSTSGSLARQHGASTARPLSRACDTRMPVNGVRHSPRQSAVRTLLPRTNATMTRLSVERTPSVASQLGMNGCWRS
jgi:hypothetical protein